MLRRLSPDGEFIGEIITDVVPQGFADGMISVSATGDVAVFGSGSFVVQGQNVTVASSSRGAQVISPTGARTAYLPVPSSGGGVPHPVVGAFDDLGRLYVAERNAAVRPDYSRSPEPTPIKVRRFVGGALDTAWASAGTATVNGLLVGGFDVGPDGSVVVAGAGKLPGGYDARLVLIAPNGSVGQARQIAGVDDQGAPISAVEVLGSGRILFALNAPEMNIASYIYRFTPSGAPDTSWGDKGRVWVNRPADQTVQFSASDPYVDSIVVQRDGAVVASGANDKGYRVYRMRGEARTPSAPAVTVAAAAARSITVGWTAPSPGSGGAISGYRVERLGPGSTTVLETLELSAAARSATFSSLPPAAVVRVRVTARNPVGMGTPSATVATVAPFATLDAFVTRQHQDFAWRSPTAAESTTWRTSLTDGTSTPAARIAALSTATTWVNSVDRVSRLYYAFFRRPPDTPGLTYWADQLRAGRTIFDTATLFSRSQEFRTTYGTLTNKAFVDLVYQNVLGRLPDAAGSTYWTGELTSGRKPRGQVMVGFSESVEHRTRRSGETVAIGIHFGMLRRVPTSAELVAWTIPARTDRLLLIESILDSAAYDVRI